jgi:hypothetical protein
MATNKRAEAAQKRRAAQKQKPITVGKGTSYTGSSSKNPRPVSARASNASKLRAAKKTTSSGITQRPDGRRQSEGRSGRTKTSTANVTQGSNGKPASSGSAKVTTGQGSKLASSARASAKTGAVAGAIAKGAAHAAAFKAGITSRNTADGTLKGKPTGPAQGPKAPARLTQAGINKMSFDDAFRQARKAGQKEFTWKGNRYHTRLK